jgi:hypothetical protein
MFRESLKEELIAGFRQIQASGERLPASHYASQIAEIVSKGATGPLYPRWHSSSIRRFSTRSKAQERLYWAVKLRSKMCAPFSGRASAKAGFTHEAEDQVVSAAAVARHDGRLSLQAGSG